MARPLGAVGSVRGTRPQAIDSMLPTLSLMLLPPMAHDFLRSLIYSRLGRDIEARSWWDRGLAQ